MLRIALDNAAPRPGHEKGCFALSQLAAFVYRADRNAVASTTSHPTMTREATAPAMILAFSLVV